jgi:hypothetical protein
MTTVGFILLPHPLHRWVSGVEPQHRSWCWVLLRSPNLDFSEVEEVSSMRYELWQLRQGIELIADGLGGGMIFPWLGFCVLWQLNLCISGRT